MIPIADAHVHFWDLEHNRYPWLEPAEPSGPFGKTSAIRRSYGLADYRADTVDQHVTRIVHVEAGWDPIDVLGEMRWIQALADRHGAPHAHIAHIDLAADGAEALIDAHCGFSLFRGVRDRLLDGDFTKASADHTRIDDPAWRRGLRALEERDLCFDLQAPPALAARAAALAYAFPRLPFILTHAGYPPAMTDHAAFDAWQDGLKQLADQTNVTVKQSGLMLAAKHWQPEAAHRAAETMLAIFGADRILVASNAPVDRLFAPVATLVANYRGWLAGLPEADQQRLLHDNACRVYRL